MKFKLWTVKNRDQEAILQCRKERQYSARVKDISKNSRGNIRSEDQGYQNTRLQQIKKKKQDTKVWDQEMQIITSIYETIIEKQEYQMKKLGKVARKARARW